MAGTFDSKAGEGFTGTTLSIDRDQEKIEIVSVLNTYLQEAKQNRLGGLNPRDSKWKDNLDLYWNRFDFSKKAHWQAKETMPEVPAFVDRFAAALKEAVFATPEAMFSVVDPADKEQDLAQAIKRMTEVWLTRVGRNQNGHILGFASVFEEQMKLGALMATSSVVTWKADTQSGRVAVETVDPQNVWLDHTYRNLYRVRRIEVDHHELQSMLKAKDKKGNSLFNVDELSAMTSAMIMDMQRKKEELTGHGQQIQSARNPIILDEYIATVVSPDGRTLADRSFMVVANEQYLVRGPERNPFWHGKDWLVYAPLVTAPLSVYGRSYMEDFGSVAKTFNELTNMILDAVHTSALKAWAIAPYMLANPAQLAEGLTPNKMFLLDEGFEPKAFAAALEMGTLSADSVKVWDAMKSELSNAAGMNEVGLGQFAPNSRTSATEIAETQQSSSALIRSVAQTVEQRYLDPTLDLIWQTGLQHVRPDDQMMVEAAGEEMFRALIGRRRELIRRNVTFQARGISNLIARSQQLKALTGILSIIASNEVLMQQFLQEIDLKKLMDMLFRLSNIDLSKLQTSERERMMRSVAEPMGAAMDRTQGTGASGLPNGPQNQEISALVRQMGIGR